MHHDAVLRDKSKIFIYKPKFTIMKRPKIEPISIVASMVFAIALILNVQTNLNGDVGMFGKQLFAQTGGTGSGSGGCEPECSPGYACVGGVCVQKEQAIRQGCTKKKWFLKCGTVTTEGHETKCDAYPTGGTNCQPIVCDAPMPSC